MSIAAPPTAVMKKHATPSFFGILAGELFKIAKFRTTWVLTIILAISVLLSHLITLILPRSLTSTVIQNNPFDFFYESMTIHLAVLRTVGGLCLLILTSHVMALEYQYGTIRILFARGVGRLQLLIAKFLALCVITGILVIGSLVLDALLIVLTTLILSGSLQALGSLTMNFWAETALYLSTVLISMGVTILLATALTILGRSLAFGLSISLIWFPVDNISVSFVGIISRLVHNDFWQNIPAYFLGPNLNAMPPAVLSEILGDNKALPVGATPRNLDGTHTLLVVLVYALIFGISAAILIRQRDIPE